MLISLIELEEEGDIAYVLWGLPAFHISQQMGSSWFAVFPWGWYQEDFMTVKTIYVIIREHPCSYTVRTLGCVQQDLSLLWRAANPSSPRQFALHFLCPYFFFLKGCQEFLGNHFKK